MKQYKGMGRVFSFTLIQQVRQKGWRTTTLLLALACLIIPIVSLTAAAQHQKNAAPDQNVTAWESYDQDVLDSAGLTSRQQELLTVRVDVSVTGGRSGEGQAADVLSMVLPFVSLMLLYFLVLLRQGRGSGSWKKPPSSWTLSLSVEPTAMVLGNIGHGSGGGHPYDSEPDGRLRRPAMVAPRRNVPSLSRWGGGGSVQCGYAGLVGLLWQVAAGCSLSIASLAGRSRICPAPTAFSLVLVASLCAACRRGMDGMTSSARWLDYVPFMPCWFSGYGADVPMGGLPWCCGRCAGLLRPWQAVCTGCALYKNPPSLRRVLRMLREK
ncbi:MAG: hypothetical protein ACLUYM_03615 [Oscillospiraceae bacterium]